MKAPVEESKRGDQRSTSNTGETKGREESRGEKGGQDDRKKKGTWGQENRGKVLKKKPVESVGRRRGGTSTKRRIDGNVPWADNVGTRPEQNKKRRERETKPESGKARKGNPWGVLALHQIREGWTRSLTSTISAPPRRQKKQGKRGE